MLHLDDGNVPGGMLDMIMVNLDPRIPNPLEKLKKVLPFRIYGGSKFETLRGDPSCPMGKSSKSFVSQG